MQLNHDSELLEQKIQLIQSGAGGGKKIRRPPQQTAPKFGATTKKTVENRQTALKGLAVKIGQEFPELFDYVNNLLDA